MLRLGVNAVLENMRNLKMLCVVSNRRKCARWIFDRTEMRQKVYKFQN